MHRTDNRLGWPRAGAVLGRQSLRALILRASCSFGPGRGGGVLFASVGSPNANPRNEFLVFANGTNDGFTTYGANAETYVSVEKGDQPRVDVYSLNVVVQGQICTLSGYTP